ncbi:probable BOI-related E3 ubiquitin-protein ligase 3 isoform X1 [Zingiber officinale]|uniref:probable BOI-related E3 ubiquitin-protein ligase 3 isoform X1 n=1 Tax=Zingiber officinale TaxID=94328 RepID=UPI001C4C2BE0|nr:probable BOI-related E3 ubiquitin-protein ligase 3 isoform X1 [Zingiber officinale]XP_042418253.1 probable BOI-related E3 ubiquitin-protein ligase 3 isoform X1 [Zingiber officinale]
MHHLIPRPASFLSFLPFQQTASQLITPPLMSVEAHRLDLFPSQLIRNGWEFVGGSRQDRSAVHDMQLGSAGGTLLPFAAPMAKTAAAASTSESGLTFNNLPEASRKRPRELSDNTLSFLGEDLSSLVQQQMFHVDRLILQHQVEKVRMELVEKLKRFLRRILAAVEEGVSKRLKAKEEEMERVRYLNLALEERVRSLCVENQMWRELARSSEATAHALRANLEQALAAAAEAQPEAAADDAESCCEGGNPAEGRRLVCRSCGEREPAVLLLPCRHLCVCAACGPAAAACPVCHCCKTGSVLVNMSP